MHKITSFTLLTCFGLCVIFSTYIDNASLAPTDNNFVHFANFSSNKNILKSDENFTLTKSSISSAKQNQSPTAGKEGNKPSYGINNSVTYLHKLLTNILF